MALNNARAIAVEIEPKLVPKYSALKEFQGTTIFASQRCPFYPTRVGIDPVFTEELLIGLAKAATRIISLELKQAEEALKDDGVLPKVQMNEYDFHATTFDLYAREIHAALRDVLFAAGAITQRERDVYYETIDSVFRGRHALMMERALPELANGNVVMAVGAAHLPGDNGLVELIRRAGFKVTRVE